MECGYLLVLKHLFWLANSIDHWIGGGRWLLHSKNELKNLRAEYEDLSDLKDAMVFCKGLN